MNDSERAFRERCAPPIRPSHSGASRRAWLPPFKILIPVAILLAILWHVDVREVGGALSALTPQVLALALLLATLDRLLMTYKWRQLVLAGAVRMRYLTALRIHYQAAASGRVVPAPLATEFLRAWLATQARVPEGVAVGSIVLEKLVSLLVSIVAALLGLAYLTGRLPSQVDLAAWFALLALGLCAALTALVLPMMSSVHRLGARLFARGSGGGAWVRRVGQLARRIGAALLHYRERRAALAVNGLLGIAEYAVQLCKLLVLAAALGVALPLVTFVASVSVMQFVRRITGSVESWGLGEGAAAVVLVVLGVQAELAVALLIAHFAISTVAVLPGVALFYTHPVDFPGREGREARRVATCESAHRNHRSRGAAGILPWPRNDEEKS